MQSSSFAFKGATGILKLMLFKSQCVLCDCQLDGKVSLCEDCRADLPIVEFACQACALPIQVDSKSTLCGQCISQKSYVDYALNLFHYATPVDYLISQMKFQQQLSVAAVLADLLKIYVESSELEHGFPEAFMPVPLYKKRLAKRGFNQSLEIIKPLVKSKNIPVLLSTIERSKDTSVQTNQQKREKKECLRLFYFVRKAIALAYCYSR